MKFQAEQRMQGIRRAATLNVNYKRHKDLTESIAYARRIQEAMMLKERHLQRIFPDSFIYYRPKEVVSGDFYWFAKQDDKVIVAAADSTGHGIPGAFMSVLGISLLNQLVMEDHLNDPATILQKLNQKIIKAFDTEEDHMLANTDGMDIAICCIDYGKMHIVFSGAFRPAYLFSSGELHEMKGMRHPIGGFRHHGHTLFENTVIPFHANDKLYLFTDGYPDQFGGMNNKKLLVKNFRELLFQQSGLPMQHQKQVLDNILCSWKGSLEQTDDVLVIGLAL